MKYCIEDELMAIFFDTLGSNTEREELTSETGTKDASNIAVQNVPSTVNGTKSTATGAVSR